MDSYLLGEWLQRWLRVYAPIRCSSGVTLQRYQGLANYILNGATFDLAKLSATPLAEVTPIQLETALLTLMNARMPRRLRLSRRSIRHVGGFVRVALQKAYLMGMIPANPMWRVELPTVERRQMHALTEDQIRALRNVCRGDWTGLLVELALATGCRRGEMLALEWQDLNWKTRVLAISKSLEETRAGLRLKCPKSGHFRACTLPESTIAMLRGAHARSRSRLIFAGEDGRWMRPALVSQVIVRRMVSAGIHNASLHSLRHTHATILISRGLPIPAVSARLGHADPHVTMKIYSHAMPLDDERLAAAWDKLVEELG